MESVAANKNHTVFNTELDLYLLLSYHQSRIIFNKLVVIIVLFLANKRQKYSSRILQINVQCEINCAVQFRSPLIYRFTFWNFTNAYQDLAHMKNIFFFSKIIYFQKQCTLGIWKYEIKKIKYTNLDLSIWWKIYLQVFR